MLKIYHVPGTRSARILWLCAELDLPLEVEPISFKPEFRMSAQWLAKNPVGKVPVMEDGDLQMFESGAMMQYILDRYGEGRLQPERGTLAHALYLQWSWFGEATFARPLGEIVNHRRNFQPEMTDIIEEMQSRALQCVAAIDQAVKDRDYLLDDFSAADIMVGYCLMLSEKLLPEHQFVHAARYWERLRDRPAAMSSLGNLETGPLAGQS